ncbi:hypothetical protein P7C70_g3821, partial [Phenoliferia sp. Uapishka_3]
MTRPVSICILGAPGVIGIRHTEHCLASPDVELTCIVDPTPFGPPFAAKHGLLFFSCVEDMLKARKEGKVIVDAAILATPNSTHVPLGIQLKPLSTDVESGRTLVRLADEKGVKILVGQHRRFHPAIVNAKEMVSSGVLGRSTSQRTFFEANQALKQYLFKVLGVSGVWSTCKPDSYFDAPATAWRKDSKAGGPILINLVHDLDLLRHLFGDITRVYAEGGVSTRGHEVEETGVCTLKFTSGAVGTFLFSDAAPSPYNFEAATGENPLFPLSSQNIYTILGTSGSTSFPELRRWHYSISSGCWTDTLTQEPAKPVDQTPPFTRQLANFVDVVRGDATPECSGSDALRTIMTLEAVKKSLKTGLPISVYNDAF